MSVPRELYLFFLTNRLGQSYYVENGIVKTRLTPTWLPEAPDGWMNTDVSLGRNAKYHGLNRTFTNPLRFVGDGATIIRHLFYTKKGVEEELYLNINKWNDKTGIYETYTPKCEVDLSEIDDDAALGVTVNLIEGGLLKKVKANETKEFEIPCDGSIPENVLVELDGMLFRARYNYFFPEVALEITTPLKSFTPPVVFLNSEGDSVGVIRSDQTFDSFDDPAAYCASSANCIFESVAPITIQLSGFLKFSWEFSDDNYVRIEYRKSTDGSSVPAGQVVFEQSDLSQQEYLVDLSTTITLQPGEKLFVIIVLGNSNFLTPAFRVNIQESNLFLDFDSKYQTTTTWGITAENLFKLLVNRVTDGEYEGMSNLLAEYPDLVVTCGMALRRIDKAVIKTSLNDFFTSFNAILNACIGNEKSPGSPGGEVLFFERKKKVYDPSEVTMDLGEVSKLKISVAKNYFFNELEIGYPDKKYDEKQGMLEYNTTSRFSAPGTKIARKLQLVSTYRADSYGVEYTRYLLQGNNTVNNQSDNDVFILGCKLQNFIIIANDASFDTVDGQPQISFPGVPHEHYHPGLKITLLIQSTNTTLTLTIKEIFVTTTGYTLYVYEPVPTVVSNVLGSYTIHLLHRETYDSVSGIPNQDSAYNIENLTPKRMLLAHGNYLRGVWHNMPSQFFKHLTTDKNKDLVTVKDGVTIAESADVVVESLEDPLFYPYIFKFRTKVPATFEQLIKGAANGHIRFSFNGVQVYGFPLDISAKPTLDDVQEWTLLCSPQTDLLELQDLEFDGLNIINASGMSLFVPHLNGVRFVPLGQVLPAQYHFKHMDEWWYHERIQHYVEQPRYAQKWQKNDLIPIQCQTNGLGPVKVEVIDCKGVVHSTINIPHVNDPSVVLPQLLYEGNINISGLDEGLYYFLLTAGLGGTVAQMISEPIEVRNDHPGTLLFEAWHKKNKQACVFTTGFKTRFRVEGWIDEFQPESEATDYVNQPADIETLDGIPYRTERLNIGTKQGCPDWVADKVNRIMLLSSKTIDGKGYSRNTDAKWEKVTTPGTPLKFWTLPIREASNRQGISVEAAAPGGQQEIDLTVVYNIDTSAFGDGAGSANVVQVTEVDHD